MPLAALLARLAPPARAVVVPAAENIPTVRTVVSASALKSAGKVEDVVVVAGMPIESKTCVYNVDVDTDMAAKAIATNVETSTETEVVTIKKREYVRDADLDLNIDVPLSR
jgi:L-2-hydroxyglutarate oxidase LhgO